MVVFIHNKYVSEIIIHRTPNWLQYIKHLISTELSACAVPAFFLMSSIFLFKKENLDWKNNIIKKCKTLMLPYFLINTFWIVFYGIAQNIPALKNCFSNSGDAVVAWGWEDWLDKYFGLTGYPICYPLWFLRDLFVLNVLAIAIKKVIDLFPKIVFVLLILLMVLNVKSPVFCLSSQAFCFFSLGYYIVKYNIRVSSVDKIKCYHISIIYIFLLLTELISWKSSLGVFIHSCSIIVGIVFWFRCTTVLRGKRIKKFMLIISKYTFGIYIFHEKLLTILKAICCKILPQTVLFQLFEYFGIPVIIVICCIVLCILIEKWFPSLYSVLMGKRSK